MLTVEDLMKELKKLIDQGSISKSAEIEGRDIEGRYVSYFKDSIGITSYNNIYFE